MNNPNAADNLKPFTKDYQPAKNGRPKGSRNMTTILREMMDVIINNPKLIDQYKTLFPEYFPEGVKGKQPRELIMLRLMTKALEGDLRATEIILDRVEGKVSQPIEHQGNAQIIVQSQKDKKALDTDYTK